MPARAAWRLAGHRGSRRPSERKSFAIRLQIFGTDTKSRTAHQPSLQRKAPSRVADGTRGHAQGHGTSKISASTCSPVLAYRSFEPSHVYRRGGRAPLASARRCWVRAVSLSVCRQPAIAKSRTRVPNMACRPSAHGFVRAMSVVTHALKSHTRTPQARDTTRARAAPRGATPPLLVAAHPPLRHPWVGGSAAGGCRLLPRDVVSERLGGGAL